MCMSTQKIRLLKMNPWQYKLYFWLLCGIIHALDRTIKLISDSNDILGFVFEIILRNQICLRGFQ